MNRLILVADDDTSLTALMQHHLTALGYHVTAVNDGVQATLKAKEIRPDLLILDIQMPGTYGTTVYENLRGDPATRGIPVLFISGSLMEEVFRKRIPADARNRFLKKPFDLEALTRSVRDLLGESK